MVYSFLFYIQYVPSQALNYADRVHDSKTANIPMSNKDFRSIRYILAGFCIDRACWILECSLWEDKHMQQKAEKNTIGVFCVQGSQLIRCRVVLFLHNRVIEDME
ncbi:amiloride-sensitive sodium channel subunit alpha [Platysternon megacephalum]|uniref:Amiloride-sensitive sodium channel subunit alpha n=1 Tax=Platysternon megacephalum TaxID=55544 RepID=A0A4D9E0K9_9SAUR|nr:amiloride-sensitive sodium channel subunit alpha [Platysternon megacephalum]